MTTREAALLTPESLATIQAALSAAGVDGWLLYDFRGCNPVARSMIGLEGMQSRRVFAWVPATGKPIAISHAIEQLAWAQITPLPLARMPSAKSAKSWAPLVLTWLLKPAEHLANCLLPSVLQSAAESFCR